MHKTLRAPELSATSNMLSACTIDQVLRLRRLELHRFVDHAAESPPFVAAERPALDDRHAIADRALVLFIVHLVALPPREELAVFRVLHTAVDGDHRGLVHFVADDDPDACLAIV